MKKKFALLFLAAIILILLVATGVQAITFADGSTAVQQGQVRDALSACLIPSNDLDLYLGEMYPALKGGLAVYLTGNTLPDSMCPFYKYPADKYDGAYYKGRMWINTTSSRQQPFNVVVEHEYAHAFWDIMNVRFREQWLDLYAERTDPSKGEYFDPVESYAALGERYLFGMLDYSGLPDKSGAKLLPDIGQIEFAKFAVTAFYGTVGSGYSDLYAEDDEVVAGAGLMFYHFAYSGEARWHFNAYDNLSKADAYDVLHYQYDVPATWASDTSLVTRGEVRNVMTSLAWNDQNRWAGPITYGQLARLLWRNHTTSLGLTK